MRNLDEDNHWRGFPSNILGPFQTPNLHVPNAIQTIHNEKAYLIIYCLNSIRCMQNSTFETGLVYACCNNVCEGLSLGYPKGIS